MDAFDSVPQLDETPSPEVARILERYSILRNLFHCLSIALLILTGTLFIFIYRELVVVRRQSSELSQMIQAYDQTNTRAAVVDFQQKFYKFSLDNTEFRPIYLKYFGTNVVPTPVATPMTNPAKAPAVTP